MKPLTIFDGHAAHLPLANADTDQILPARFLKKPRGHGYQDFLFFDHRWDADGTATDFVLNRHPDVSVLVAGPAFGSGSSREGAVYALVDFGIRAVIAPSFGDIFRANATRNGLLCAVVAEADHRRLIAAMGRGMIVDIRIDLPAQMLSIGPDSVGFTIDPGDKERLIGGLDDIGITRQYSAEIAAYEEELQQSAPWRILRPR